jgi:hypothetical protein
MVRIHTVRTIVRRARKSRQPCCMDFEVLFVFFVGEEGINLLLSVQHIGTNFKVLERANPYSCTDFLGTEIEADFGIVLVL